jgi:gluconolactonase
MFGVSGLALTKSPGAESITARYPNPDVITVEQRFGGYTVRNTPVERIYQGTLWAEGPAWNGVGRYLIWSDIPRDEQLRWLEEDGHVSRQFRYPAGNSNGNTFDHVGRQISCQHGTRRVVRYEYDGSITILADGYGGKEFNAPNDAVVHPEDGSIWFTDPGYGSLSDYEGSWARTGSVEPFQKEAIYRIDAQTGSVEKVADDPYKPNGLAFSPDLKRLYVADTGKSHYEEADAIIWVYEVQGNRLSRARTFANMEMEGLTGFADGLTTDIDGNVWSSAGWVGDGYDGVHVFAPDGERIGLIRLPEICSNVCFGGKKRNRLFMTASQSVYSLYVNTRGAHILGA